MIPFALSEGPIGGTLHAKDASVVAGIAIYRKIFIGSYILDIERFPRFIIRHYKLVSTEMAIA